MNKLTPSWVALLYAAFASAWIAFSGYLLTYAVSDPEIQRKIEIGKGFLFVVVTSVILYLLLKVWHKPLGIQQEAQETKVEAPHQKQLYALLLILALSIPLTSFLIFKFYAPQAEKEAISDQQVIARLKTAQIESWLDERLSDVELMAADRHYAQDLRYLIQHGDGPEAAEVGERFEAFIKEYQYCQILLVDKNSKVVLSRGRQLSMAPELMQKLQLALQSSGPVRTDLYLDQQANIHLDWVAPVLDANHHQVLGAVVFRTDPSDFILPIANIWPVHYGAAQTLLIDSKSGRILYPYKSSAQSSFSRLDQAGDLDYQLFSQVLNNNDEGMVKGTDSQGHEVLGAYSTIPLLDWKLVTKVDRAVVLKPLYSMVLWMGLLAFFALIAVVAAFALLWKQRQYLSDLAVLTERNKADRLLQQVYDLPFVGIAVLAAPDRSWIRFNGYLCKLLGYERRELVLLNWDTLFHPDDFALHQEQCAAIFSGEIDACKMEIRLLRKDGSYLHAILDAKAVRRGNGSVEHVIVTVSDVSELTALTARLAERESHLSALFNTIPDLVWVKDVQGVYMSCNHPFEQLYGASESVIVGKTDYDFVSKEEADFFRKNDQMAMAAGAPSINEEWLEFAGTGERAYFETIKAPIKDAQGQMLGVLGVARDITERYESQNRIKRLNQLYSWQAKCNKAIVWCNSELELFKTICADAVEVGGLSLAWVGLVNPDTHMIEPVAFSGSGTEYLLDIQISTLADSPYGQGPTGKAARLNQPIWCQDFQHDPSTLPWRDRAMKFGWNSSASLPLQRNGVVIGCLTLYSNLKQTFDTEVQELLMSVISDISFALKSMDLEEEQKKAEVNLTKLSLAVEQSPNTIVITDLDANIEYVNAAFSSVTGYTFEEVTGNNPRILQSGMTSKAVYDEMWASLTSGHVWKGELVNKRKDGSIYTEFAIISPVRQKDGSITNYLAIKTDITEFKQNEAKLKLSAKVFEQGNEGIIITDDKCNMIMVNRAFTTICGYSEEEVLGKNPRILASGHQGEEFYRDMWASISTKGFWQGELWNRKKDGTVYPELLSISKVFDEVNGQTQYIGIFTDITQHKIAEENIKWLAHFDVLTGLPNRILLNDRINQALSVASRNQQSVALMFLDLDRFKNVNDSLGHHVGDQLLKGLAQRLLDTLRDDDTVSRLGGDEFVLLLGNTDVKGATLVAEKVLKVISQPIQVEQYELSITPSIGIAIYPNDGQDYSTLLKSADTAMYRTKQNGRNNYCFFTQDMQAAAERTLSLDNALRRAIEREQFVLYYQPQMDLMTGELVGAEALIRWQHPEMGMIPPAEFIPVAEESGQILQIGEWVLRAAIRQFKQWMDRGFKPFTMAVNLSAVQFRFQNLPELVGGILIDEEVAPEYLELEITESAAMDNPESVVLMMQRLHKLGINLSIDDFGTGYSSLSYLKRLKVNKLKIDQSFVRHVLEDSDDKAIIIGIIGMAQSLGMQTIAEGVETEGQRDFLKEHSCDEMQGFLISRPVPAAEFEAFLTKGTD